MRTAPARPTRRGGALAGLLAALLAGACGDSAAPAGVDGGVGVEAGTDSALDSHASDLGRPEAAGDGVSDAGTACTSSVGCGAGRFCGGSGQCVSAVKVVAAGSIHTCALHADGRVSCWGHGRFIGPDMPVVTLATAVPLGGRATALAVGAEAACAVLEDRSVQCWGELGGTSRAPVTITREDGQPLGGVTQLAGGTIAFCAANAAGVHCWGSNKAAELGRPITVELPATTAVLVRPGPVALLAATVAIAVHDGQQTLCGWGNNDSGIIPGARGIVVQPTCAPGLPGVRALSAGDGHLCAVRGADSFSCWGSNSGGQLGTGDDSLLDVELPGQSIKLPAPIVTVAAGGYHTCALLEGGAVQCWGSNERGECGKPSSAPVFSPIPVTAPRFVALGSGAEASHTCGVLADGSVQCWGFDDRGQLGSGVTSEDPVRYSAAPVVVRF